MSFFQGMAQAFKDADDQRFRMKVLGEEQDFMRQRDQAGFEHDRAMRMLEINARRQEALLTARATRAAASAGTTQQVNPAALTYFGQYGVEDQEFLGVVNRNPEFAADLMKKVEDENADRAEKGFPALTPQEVVETWRVYQTEIPATPGWSTEDLLELDPTDPNFETRLEELTSQPQAQPATTVPGFVTNTGPLIREDFAQQVEAVNGVVASILRSEMARLVGDDSVEANQRKAEINSLLEGIEGGDQFATNRAYELYGSRALEVLQEAGYQGMSTAQRNPLLAPIFMQPSQEAATEAPAPQPMVTPAEEPAPVSEPPTQSGEDTGERTLIQQDFNSMEEAQAFLQTLPPGRYFITVDGQEYPATVR
jgi:hypothetical protein